MVPKTRHKSDPQREMFPRSLPDVFRSLHNFLYTNSNLPRAERLGAEMVRLIFCKIYDELYNGTDSSFRPGRTPRESHARINCLFDQVKKAFPDVFAPDEKIHLNEKAVHFVVSELCGFELLRASRDAIGEAFQAFWGPGLRGEKGQFFTPRNVVRMCIGFLDPQPGERIIDPACGSGGFLVETISHISRKEDPTNFTEHIFGIDKEIDLAKIARAYMSLIGNGHSQIFCADSLDPRDWPETLREQVREESFDVVMTNPPFGARISIEDRRTLDRYELGKNKPREAPQVLFIERCLQLLKPGGRMAIVLPDGIFGNPGQRDVIEYVLAKSRVLAVVSLPPETFLPSTHTKTSVLFIEKKPSEGSTIFMAIAKKVGHDKNGKVIYKMKPSGEYVLDPQGQPIVDDDLPEVTKKYRAFKNGERDAWDHLGFVVEEADLKDNILIPGYYDPELEGDIKKLGATGEYELVRIGNLVKEGLILMSRGHEIGSRYYGMGTVPFVRTSDIVNWEIKFDPVKSIPEEIYQAYKDKQDIRENDILLVTDGTFLIGRSSIVTSLDTRIVIQSHIKKIRCLRPEELHPYLLLYLLNTEIVQRQIAAKTFVQATISTVGRRLNEVILPIPRNKSVVAQIIKEVDDIIRLKREARERMEKLVKNGRQDG